MLQRALRKGSFACIALIAWELCVLPSKADDLRYPKISYAKNFSIAPEGDSLHLRVVNPWRGSGDIGYSYLLVPKGAKERENPGDALVIRTPVERIVTLGTVYQGHLAELSGQSLVVGASSTEYAQDPILHRQIQDGTTRPLASENGIDIESLMLLRPDLILANSIGSSQLDAQPKLARAGLPVVLTAGYMETHPLAQAEWIKFIAVFLGKQEQAEAFFDELAERYETLVRNASAATERPTVLVNAPFGGRWHVPGGDSFTAQFLRDAGAIYPWENDQSTGGIPLDTETVIARAARTDYWIHPGRAQSISKLLAMDSRFTLFEAIRKKRVYNNTLLVNPQGGNMIWERGILHPDEVLADLIKIFHPSVMPDHTFVFYERLE